MVWWNVSGIYKLIPFYKGENTVFDVSPPSMLVSVQQDHAIIPQRFQVQYQLLCLRKQCFIKLQVHLENMHKKISRHASSCLIFLILYPISLIYVFNTTSKFRLNLIIIFYFWTRHCTKKASWYICFGIENIRCKRAIFLSNPQMWH